MIGILFVPAVLYLLGFNWIILLCVVALVRGAVRKIEVVYSCALWLLYLVSFALSLASFTPREFSVYFAAFIQAAGSGLLVFTAVWLIRKWDATLPRPTQCAIVASCFFFTFDLGYYFIVDWLNAIWYPPIIEYYAGLKEAVAGPEATRLAIAFAYDAFDSTFHHLQLNTEVCGQLSSFGVLLAPPLAAVVWAFQFLYERRSFEPRQLLRLNLAILWIFVALLVGIRIVFKVQCLSSVTLRDSDSLGGMLAGGSFYKEDYLILTEMRHLLFESLIYDLLIALYLILVTVVATSHEGLYRWRNGLFVIGFAAVGVLAALPYYIGQEAAVDGISKILSGPSTSQMAIRMELVKISPLYPRWGGFSELVSILLVGGAMLVAVNLHGLRVELGRNQPMVSLRNDRSPIITRRQLLRYTAVAAVAAVTVWKLFHRHVRVLSPPTPRATDGSRGSVREINLNFETLESGRGKIDGPRVDEKNRLYFSDVQNGGVYRRSPNGTIETLIPRRRRVGGIALNYGGGIVCSGRTLIYWDERTQRSRELLTEWEGRPLKGLNDLQPDDWGSVYVGSLGFDPLSDQKPTPGDLFRVDPDGKVIKLWEGIEVSAGMGFSPDRKHLFHADSTTQALWVYDVQPDRTVKDRRVFGKLPVGWPAGIAVDAEGGIFVAVVNDGGVMRFRPNGTLDWRLKVPARMVTSLTFGGKNLEDLYIVTADNTDDKVKKGTIFKARSKIPGLPVPESKFK